jgi:hypothetical protein
MTLLSGLYTIEDLEKFDMEPEYDILYYLVYIYNEYEIKLYYVSIDYLLDFIEELDLIVHQIDKDEMYKIYLSIIEGE